MLITYPLCFAIVEASSVKVEIIGTTNYKLLVRFVKISYE